MRLALSGSVDPVMDDESLSDIAGQLGRIGGIVGVMLGGSRARGDDVATSDVDIGIYYRPPLDITAMAALARRLAGPTAEVTAVGQWGRWVDGGAWLTIDGRSVDWIYRDVDRVRDAWGKAQHGEFSFNDQVGHPFGVPDFAYAGEVALGVVLTDPSGQLAVLQRQASTYPPALADALVQRLWEADFLIGGLRKSMLRTDSVWMSGCLFRVVMLCVHALHGRAGRWLINEKGAVESAARLTVGPPDFADRARTILGQLGTTPAELASALAAASDLIADCRSAVR